MLRILSKSMGSLQTWSSNEFFSAAVLKQRKRAQLKTQTPKRVRYLLHYFDQNSYSPPLGPQRAFGGFSKFKKRYFWPTYAFQRFPWISSLFHTVFNTKSLIFTARPLAHRSACQRATYTNAGPISQKFVFYASSKAVKIINSAPLQKFQRYYMNASSGFFQKV